MRRLFAFLVIFSYSSAAFAEAAFAPVMNRAKFNGSVFNGANPLCNQRATTGLTPMSSCPILSAVALTAAPGSRTFTINVFGYSGVRFQVNYTFGAATAVTLTCKGSLDGGNTFASFTTGSITSGTNAGVAYVDSWTTGSASANFLLPVAAAGAPAAYDTRGLDVMQCVVAGTGSPTGADLVTIFGVASAGQ